MQRQNVGRFWFGRAPVPAAEGAGAHNTAHHPAMSTKANYTRARRALDAALAYVAEQQNADKCPYGGEELSFINTAARNLNIQVESCASADAKMDLLVGELEACMNGGARWLPVQSIVQILRSEITRSPHFSVKR